MAVPTVLVTGVRGFIAAELARQLRARGFRVRGTVRSASAGAAVADDPGYEEVEADLLEGVVNVLSRSAAVGTVRRAIGQRRTRESGARHLWTKSAATRWFHGTDTTAPQSS